MSRRGSRSHLMPRRVAIARATLLLHPAGNCEASRLDRGSRHGHECLDHSASHHDFTATNATPEPLRVISRDRRDHRRSDPLRVHFRWRLGVAGGTPLPLHCARVDRAHRDAEHACRQLRRRGGSRGPRCSTEAVSQGRAFARSAGFLRVSPAPHRQDQVHEEQHDEQTSDNRHAVHGSLRRELSPVNRETRAFIGSYLGQASVRIGPGPITSRFQTLKRPSAVG